MTLIGLARSRTLRESPNLLTSNRVYPSTRKICFTPARWQGLVSSSFNSNRAFEPSSIPCYTSTHQRYLQSHMQPPQRRTFALNAKKNKSIKKTRRSQNPTQEKLFRADKVLATRTEYSRSQASALIQEQRVAYDIPAKKKTNDKDGTTHQEYTLSKIQGPKYKLPMDAILYLDGNEIPQLPPKLMVYHKEKFVLSAFADARESKRHLGQVLPSRVAHIKQFHPVGRLDYDTSGLILFSQDGDLTQRLLHPKYGVEKEYMAVVLGDATVSTQTGFEVEEEKGIAVISNLGWKLQQGVETTEGTHTASLTRVERLDEAEKQAIIQSHKEGEERHERESAFDRLETAKVDSIILSRVQVVVQEGKYRMVRRMLANCGHPVVELKRIRHGIVDLGDLEEGEFRDCASEELTWAEGLFAQKPK